MSHAYRGFHTQGMKTCRTHGGGVPEYWGKDSPYHPGTGFLGTPPDHLEVRELVQCFVA